MPWGIIFIFIIIILTIVFIFYGYNIIQNKFNPPPTPDITPGSSSTVINTTKYTGWSQTKPDPDRGICAVYNFPNGINLDPVYIDTLTPVPIPPLCINIDQLSLQKVTTTCVGGGLTGDVCYDSSGKQYQIGDVKERYTQCQANACTGTPGNIALNFTPAYFNTVPQKINSCIELTNQQILNQVCSDSNENQRFLLDRQNPDGSVNATGVYGKISKDSLCLAPITDSVGSNLKLTDCTTLPANGYLWWLYPGGQVNNATTVQQILYYPNINKTPPNTDNYNTLLSITPETIQGPNQCSSNYGLPVSMQYAKSGPNQNACWNNQQAQFLDQPLYDLISSTPSQTFPF